MSIDDKEPKGRLWSPEPREDRWLAAVNNVEGILFRAFMQEADQTELERAYGDLHAMREALMELEDWHAWFGHLGQPYEAAGSLYDPKYSSVLKEVPEILRKEAARLRSRGFQIASNGDNMEVSVPELLERLAEQQERMLDLDKGAEE